MPPRTEIRSFDLELDIAAPARAVWEALATVEGLRRWFSPDAELEPRPGGRMVWRWGEEHVWVLRIDEWEPGSRLLARYDSTVDDGAGGRIPLFVELSLAGEGGRTRLRLVHRGFGPDARFDQEYDGISRGWPVELESLRLSLERHAGRSRAVAWRVAATDLAPDDAWRRLFGPEGLACGRELTAARAGDRLAFTMPAGERYESELLALHAHELCARVHSHGDAFLRVALESSHGAGARTAVWLWFARWDVGDAELAPVREAQGALLARLFPSPSTAGA